MKPLISVLLPVYKQDDVFLAKAIDSILSQTISDIELLLLDDDCTPSNKIILEKYKSEDSRVKIITNSKNLGLITTLNNAIPQCLGNYIARMDSDDISYPERFERQLLYLQHHDLDMVGCFAITTDNDENHIGYKQTSDSHLSEKIIKKNPIIHSSYFAKKQFFEIKYDPQAYAAEDYDILLRAYFCHNYKIGVTPEHLLMVRRNPSGISPSNLFRQQHTIIKSRLRHIPFMKYPYRLTAATLQNIFVTIPYMYAATKVGKLLSHGHTPTNPRIIIIGSQVTKEYKSSLSIYLPTHISEKLFLPPFTHILFSPFSFVLSVFHLKSLVQDNDIICTNQNKLLLPLLLLCFIHRKKAILKLT